MSAIKAFFKELVARRVLRTLGGYAVIVWGLGQGFADLFPAMGIPEWTVPAFIYSAIALSPVVAFIAWRYQLTGKGLILDPRDRLENMDGTAIIKEVRQRHDKLGVAAVTLKWQGEDGSALALESMGPIFIGRDDGCDVVIKEKLVSRSHAVIWAHNSRWYVTDLQSSNGTWRGVERLTNELLLREDVITLGKEGPAVTLMFNATDLTYVSTVARGQSKKS